MIQQFFCDVETRAARIQDRAIALLRPADHMAHPQFVPKSLIWLEPISAPRAAHLVTGMGGVRVREVCSLRQCLKGRVRIPSIDHCDI